VVKPPFRTKTLSTKVSDEEFRDLEAVASKGGEEMQGLIDRADSDKVRKARERLEQASDSKQT
jgi:hypothetical protein